MSTQRNTRLTYLNTKIGTKRGKIKKKLVQWGIKNRAESTLIPFLLHGISLWLKGHLPLPPPNIPIQVESAFNKQSSIGCLQERKGLLAHEWAETHNAYMKYLG